jgi:hypothetical protein
MSLHEVSDWIASAVLTTIGYFTRLVFGDDHLTKKQLFAFYAFCGGVLWITNTFIEAGILRSSIQLAAGLVIPNLIKGVIGGAKKSEKKISDTIEHNVENISEKVDKISDAITGGNDKK